MSRFYSYNPERYRTHIEPFLKRLLEKLGDRTIAFGAASTGKDTGFTRGIPDWFPPILCATKMEKKGVQTIHAIVCETTSITYNKWDKENDRIDSLGFWSWITGEKAELREKNGPEPKREGYVLCLVSDGDVLFVLHPEDFPNVTAICAVAYNQHIKKIDEALAAILNENPPETHGVPG